MGTTMTKRRPQLIENWRRAWRMLSVQMQALAFALLGAWQVLPDEIKAMLPPTLAPKIVMALLVAGILGRLIQQPSTRSPTADAE